MSNPKGKPRYHQSEIKDTLKCGIYAEFRYLQGLPTPARSAATVGNVVDSTVNHLLRKKIKGESPTLEEALDVASSEFESRRQSTQIWDEPADQLKDSALTIVKLFQIQVAATIEPETVQEEFVIDTDRDYMLGGTIDYTDKRGFLGDIKTASPTRASSYIVNGALQPALYHYAYTALRGREPVAFRFDVMTRTTNGTTAYKPVSGQVTQADLEFAFRTIDQVHAYRKAGIALPAPEGSWWCSKKWCPFWDLCKGKK